MRTKHKFLLLIVKDEHPSLTALPSGYQKARLLMERRIWLLRRQPSDGLFEAQGNFLIYVAGKRDNAGMVIGKGVFASAPLPLRASAIAVPAALVSEKDAQFYVRITRFTFFRSYFNLRAERHQLELVTSPNSKKWGASVMGAYRLLSEHDFRLIAYRR